MQAFGQAGDLFGEGASGTGRGGAQEAADGEVDNGPSAAQGGVMEPPSVAAVHPFGRVVAGGASCVGCAGAGVNPHEVGGLINAFDDDPGQVREEGTEVLVGTRSSSLRAWAAPGAVSVTKYGLDPVFTCRRH
ncbi:hypothetical protein GCM10022205_18020 [Spinactinospora alkalitolerans]